MGRARWDLIRRSLIHSVINPRFCKGCRPWQHYFSSEAINENGVSERTKVIEVKIILEKGKGECYEFVAAGQEKELEELCIWYGFYTDAHP